MLCQIAVSESVFSGLFLKKAKVIASRQLRVNVPPHPDNTVHGANNKTIATPPWRDLGVKRSQQQQHHSRTVHPPSSEGAKATSYPKARLSVAAWHHGPKLILRVYERPAGGGSAAGRGLDTGKGDTAGAASRLGSADGVGAGPEGVLSENSESDGCRPDLFDKGGSVIVIHENEVTSAYTTTECFSYKL